eukprot:218537-Pleurochrysis_carterae.AAC.4
MLRANREPDSKPRQFAVESDGASLSSLLRLQHAPAQAVATAEDVAEAFFEESAPASDPLASADELFAAAGTCDAEVRAASLQTTAAFCRSRQRATARPRLPCSNKLDSHIFALSHMQV